MRDAEGARRRRVPSVARAEDVRWVFGAVKSHEETLHVAIEPALAHLIGVDLHERVVSAFRSRGQLERAELPGIGSRTRRRRVLSESNFRKELISALQRGSFTRFYIYQNVA